MGKAPWLALGLLVLGLGATAMAGKIEEGAARAGDVGLGVYSEKGWSEIGIAPSWNGGGKAADPVASLGVAECPAEGNDGFEAGVVDTNEIPCWTVVDNTAFGSWCNQTGTAPPQGPCSGPSAATVSAPPEGSRAAMTNQGGAGAHLLFRCGMLTSGTVSFHLYVNNRAPDFYSPPSLSNLAVPNQQFRADLVTEAGMAADPFTVAPKDVLLNIYQTDPGDPLVSVYSLVSADVSAFSGLEVCLRFAEVDNQLWGLHAGIDDVRFGGKDPTGDTDHDGCRDMAENGPDETLGGQRDYLNFWDFFDVPTGATFERDGNVTGLDIFAVIVRFNATDAGPGDFDRNSDPFSTPNPPAIGQDRANYHPAYDRGVLVGPDPDPWDLGPADGAITGQDIFAVIAQFGHSCS